MTYKDFKRARAEVHDLMENLDAFDAELFDEYEENEQTDLVQHVVMIRNMLKSIEVQYFEE